MFESDLFLSQKEQREFQVGSYLSETLPAHVHRFFHSVWTERKSKFIYSGQKAPFTQRLHRDLVLTSDLRDPITTVS